MSLSVISREVVLPFVEWKNDHMEIEPSIHRTLAITANGEQAFAEFEGGHSHETKISAVHFVRFHPTVEMKEVFADLRKSVTDAGYIAVGAGVPIVLQSLHIVSGRGHWLSTTYCPPDREWKWKAVAARQHRAPRFANPV